MNPPFRGNTYAANKKLDEGDLAKLEKTIPKEERLLFVIVGDLSIGSKYAKSFLAVTEYYLIPGWRRSIILKKSTAL